MRLFTAVDISAETRKALAELISQLAPAAPFRWSRPDNLHITTKFIGAWQSDDIEKLRRTLGSIPKQGSIEIAIRGLGWFPNPHNPRVLFAGVEAGPELETLQRQTDAACLETGVAAETKKFHPHLTLARISTPDGLQTVRQKIAELPHTEFGQFTVSAFYLYESVAGPRGSEYRKLDEFSLL
jgi:RNA 2',3'-cyclic 3'-phosphodiesterase